MSAALKFVPPRVAFVDPRTGCITREWYLFLQGLFNRAGGVSGDSTDELALAAFDDSGTEELEAQLFSVADGLWQFPPQVATPADEQAQLLPAFEPAPVDIPATLAPAFEPTTPDPDQLADLAALRAEVDALRQAVQSLQQGTTL
jgi:hypothetical protein